jgi:hypothetical protein
MSDNNKPQSKNSDAKKTQASVDKPSARITSDTKKE